MFEVKNKQAMKKISEWLRTKHTKEEIETLKKELEKASAKIGWWKTMGISSNQLATHSDKVEAPVQIRHAQYQKITGTMRVQNLLSLPFRKEES